MYLFDQSARHLSLPLRHRSLLLERQSHEPSGQLTSMTCFEMAVPAQNRDLGF
jgi:hypothetical protein